MSKLNRKNLDDARKIIDKLLPNETTKREVLSFLSNAMIYANDLDSGNWNVNLDKNGGYVQFNTGQEYAVKIYSKGILILVLKELVPKELARGNSDITFQGHKNHRDFFSTSLKDTPDLLAKVTNSVGCVLSRDSETAKTMSLLEKASQAYIKEAITSTKIKPNSTKAHSPGFVDYLSKYFDKLIPNPSYVTESFPILDSLDDIEKYKSSYDNLPETERQAVVKGRIGQGRFREELLIYWGGKCAVTGCEIESMLRASHIKPWRVASNQERLDIYNGLLLIPNLDAAFDAGLISFENDGKIMISHFLENQKNRLGIYPNLRINKVQAQHKKYLQFHRNNIFIYE